MSVDIIAVPRSTALLARANPLAKLGAGMVLTIVLLISVDWVSATVALVLECALLPLAGLSLRMLLRRGWPILFAAIVGGYGTALLAPKTGELLLSLGPVTFTTGSLEAGVAIALRGLAVALPGIIVLASTDPTDLADALAQKLRLPHRFVLGALAAMRLVGLLVTEWQTLGMARRARGVGGEPGLFRGLKAQLGQAMALLVQAVRRASRLAVTMEAKGFGAGPRTWARVSAFSPLDVWVAAGGLAIAAAAVSVAVVLGTWNPVFG
ncbi:ABC-type cobalt transporter, permease CbiQ [Arthrobacter sp. PAMC 25486]|uniref:energy-coupling factor transporter transmembrane component T family protein n=1 Tax=Arthrobacter sp. PAMC 25486 TaxID=1494608 RepID=UPI000535E4B9|nr:energy-coupling factor transporter transmembrane component T [Arthrobacter sp. PAMC 25486]AIY02561.1 ABC-type cobalt transporter, permease CbiQ [Arthrobacter sp. PAMC 25486]